MSEQTYTPTTPPPSDLPLSPRPLTARGLARSWQEPTVRFCWLSAIALLLVAVYLIIARYVEWRGEAALVKSGAVVTATVFDPASERTGVPLRFGELARLRFDWQGQARDVTGYLEDIGQKYTSGDPIPIRIDPADPQRWTNRTEATSLVSRLIGGYTAVLAALGTAIGAWVTRNYHRTLWRQGVPREAIVASHELAPMAPRSVRLRCHVTQGRDILVVRVYVPQNEAVPAVGAKLWLLCDPENWRNAIPVLTYYP